MTAQPSTDLPPGLAQPARRALAGAGIARLEQLASFREAEIKALRAALAERGLAFKK